MPKILVIEDEPDQNRLIKLRLEARGFTVLSAERAREGLAMSAREKPDLILMDMILPDMHGLDATIKLKQNPDTRFIPVIAISAVGSPDFTKACLKEGIVAYVRKPYDPRELFRTIEKFVFPDEEPGKEITKPAAGATRKYRERLWALEKQHKESLLSSPPPPRRQGKSARKKSSIDEMLKGALAGFDIPLQKKAPDPASPPAAAAKDTLRPKSVLIIDDDASFGRGVSTHLAGHGYAVDLAPDGISGLKEAFQKKPDLILLNLVLPAGGGETVLTNLRKSPESNRIPVFIMSGLLSAKSLDEKARELGAQGFISKPIDPEDLLFIIESIIGAGS
ncbi:MAG: response regulator [Candidatus Aminicenantes bacterium]|nr:response regulator [Candidatus Aminicenantes bacterium]